MTRGGLLMAGVVVPVEGLDILNPVDGPRWCRLDARDYRTRRTSWIRQVFVHGTRGGEPQIVVPGRGTGRRAQIIADFWRGDPVHSAAPLVVDTDCTIACLADIVRDAGQHAQLSNDWSIGIEMAQVGANQLYSDQLGTTARLCRALCSQLDIPFQIPTAYRGRPIARLNVYGKTPGGPDCVGVFGHRENTPDRGRGDPGDAVMLELEHAGAERLDFDRGQDLEVWKRRQTKLNAMGEQLKVDGIAGPGTMRALRRRGFSHGRELDAA